MKQSISLSNKITEVDLLRQYSLGKRKFNYVQLQGANLKRQLLKQVELRKANLSFANLMQADLSNANLSQSSLVQANFSGANLNKANFSGANLSKANFLHANLSKANLSATKFIEEKNTEKERNINSLEIAKPIKVDFRHANLTGAFLKGSELEFGNFTGAVYDDNTKFPPRFYPLNAGMVHIRMMQKFAVEELLTQFNNIYSYSIRHLGNNLCKNFLNASQPKFHWLNQFKISKSNKIIFVGTVSSFISSEQLYWFQQWVDSYTKSCSLRIKDFPEFRIVNYPKSPIKKLIPNEKYQHYRTRLSNIDLISSVVYMTRKAHSRLTNNYFKNYNFFYYCILSSIAESQFSFGTINRLDTILRRACPSEKTSDLEVFDNLKLLVNEWLSTIDLNNAVIE